MKGRLTQKQESFVLGLFKGLSQREAYLKAGYSAKQSPATLDRNACGLAKSNKILARWDELREEAEAATMLEVVERRQILAKVARGQYPQVVEKTEDIKVKGMRTGAERVFVLTSHRDPIQAIAELTKMDGIYATAPIQFNDNRILIAGELTDEQLAAIVNKGDISGRRSIGTSKQTPGPE